MRPVITLILFSSIVPELITGSTSLSGFAHPGTLLFLIVCYGLAVLVLREYALRCRMGVAGLFVAGIAYGIFNEGLLAKTSILATGLPVAEFTGYGVWLGISVPWTITISVWHACASVLFPILFTHYVIPAQAGKPWLPDKLVWILAVLLLAFGCASFLGQHRIRGTPPQLFSLLGCMALLSLVARSLRGTHVAGAPSIGAFWLGCSVFISMFIVLTKALAGTHAPAPLYAAALAVFVLAYAWRLRQKSWLAGPGLLLFAIGWYAQNLFVATVLKLSMGAWLEALLAGTICIPLMVWYGRRLLR